MYTVTGLAPDFSEKHSREHRNSRGRNLRQVASHHSSNRSPLRAVLTDDTLPAVARTGPAEAAGEAPSTDLNTHRGLNDDYPYPVHRRTSRMMLDGLMMALLGARGIGQRGEGLWATQVQCNSCRYMMTSTHHN